jgi:hypothetical protein
MTRFGEWLGTSRRERLARLGLPLLLAGIYGTLGVARALTERLRGAGLLRNAVALAFALAVVGLVVMIARDPLLRTWQAALALVLVAGAYVGVVWPMTSPEEKLHFIEYGAVALLADAAAPGRWPALRRFVAAALFTAAAGWVDEGIQALLPNRYYDLRDVGFNATAGLMALIALAGVRFARRFGASAQAAV